MTNISPLLQSKIQEQKTKNQEHERVYENLRRHANDVHPNAPKARLVNESLGESIVSCIKDTKQDIANLNTTIKTGKMSDNNLGRLNDLGMKIGGLLIASYLAIHSKSKNEAAMKFVGTAAFFASMKLWPKIFIFGPSKLIHKVDPGKKYVSAQGDKKELYLDNQFIPWDITPIKDEKEQRRHQKVALQNRTLWMATAGASVPLMTALISNRLEPVVARIIALVSTGKINRHAENMDEYIKSAKPIVKHEAEIEALCNKYKNDPLNPEFIKQLKKYMMINEISFKDPDCAKPIKDFSITELQGALNGLWKEQAEITISADDFKKSIQGVSYKAPENLAGLFSKKGKHVKPQGFKEISVFKEEEVQEIVKALFGDKKEATITYQDIADTIDGLRIKETLTQLKQKADGELAVKYVGKQLEHPFEEYGFNLNDIKNLRKQFEESKISIVEKSEITKNVETTRNAWIGKNLEEVKEVKEVKEAAITRRVPISKYEYAKGEITSGSSVVENWLKGFSWKDDSFFTAIKDYNKDVVSVSRGRLAKYLKLANSAYGSNADSIYTNVYSRTMKSLFNRLNYSVENPQSFYYKVKDFIKINILGQRENVVKATQHLSLKDIVEKDKATVVNSLVDYFSTLVKDVDFDSVEYRSIIEQLTKTGLTEKEIAALNIISDKSAIENIKKTDIQPALNKAIFGKRNSSITNTLSLYAQEQKTNINAIVSRLAMCANFEARLKEGLITIDGIDIRELPDSLKIARTLMYEGNISETVLNNAAGTVNKAKYLKVANALYSKEAFKNEDKMVQESAEKILSYLKDKTGFNATDKYLANSDLYSLVKDYATRLYPGMKWMKKVGVASAVIVGITLLMQPFFGKIRKEFPKENKQDKGGNN